MNELKIDIEEKSPVRTFKVPVKSFSDFTLEIRQITVEEADAMKLKYTEKVKAGKSFISVENEEKRDKTLLDSTRSAVVGWSGISDTAGNPVPFSPENLKAVLNRIGGIRINSTIDCELSDEKENKNLVVWIFEQATNGENFTGTAQNL